MRFSVWVFLGVIIIAIGLWLALPQIPLIRLVFGERDTTPHSDLPKTTVRAALGIDDGVGTDRLVFRDAANGWFVIEAVEQAENVQIGVYRNRIIDVLGSGRHVPIYCGGTGADRQRVLWRLRDGQIASAIAFCNPRRLDLGTLSTLGAPIEQRHELLPRDAARARISEVRADETRFLSGFDTEFSPYDQRITVRLPALWWSGEDGPTYATTERPMLDQIEAALGSQGERYRLDSRMNWGQQLQDPTSTSSRVLLKQGQDYLALPEAMRVVQIEVVIRCVEAFCAEALEAVQRAAPQGPRDAQLLAKALSDADEVDSSAPALSVAQVQSDEARVDAIPILYSVRDFRYAE